MFYPPITSFYNQLQLYTYFNILPSNLFGLAHSPIIYSTLAIASQLRQLEMKFKFVLPINGLITKILYTLEYLYPALLDDNLGQKFLWQDKIFQKNIGLGWNYYFQGRIKIEDKNFIKIENFYPRTKIFRLFLAQVKNFYLIGQNFSENFCPRIILWQDKNFFDRTDAKSRALTLFTWLNAASRIVAVLYLCHGEIPSYGYKHHLRVSSSGVAFISLYYQGRHYFHLI